METVQITCPYCGTTWTPRVPKPKTCPHCKRPLWKTQKELERAAMVREALLKTVEPLKTYEEKATFCVDCASLYMAGQLQSMQYAIAKMGNDLLCEKHLLERLNKVPKRG